MENKWKLLDSILGLYWGYKGQWTIEWKLLDSILGLHWDNGQYNGILLPCVFACASQRGIYRRDSRAYGKYIALLCLVQFGVF